MLTLILDLYISPILCGIFKSYINHRLTCRQTASERASVYLWFIFHLNIPQRMGEMHCVCFQIESMFLNWKYIFKGIIIVFFSVPLLFLTCMIFKLSFLLNLLCLSCFFMLYLYWTASSIEFRISQTLLHGHSPCATGELAIGTREWHTVFIVSVSLK